jgi:putative membrane protein
MDSMIGYSFGTGLGGWLWMVGGLIVLVVLVVWAIGRVNRTADGRTGAGARPEALDILRERFARGEITEAEFEQAK